MLLPFLPPRCRELIRERGIPLDQWNPGSHEVAFNKENALKVLDALEGSNIAVLGGDVVRIDHGRLKYVYAQWNTEMTGEETAVEFAKRSRLAAGDYVLRFDPRETYDPLFVLVLSALA